MKLYFTGKNYFVFIFCFLFSLTAFASPFDDPNFAHPPYRIKPNTPSFAPTGLSPLQIVKAYGFDKITNQGEGQVIGIVDAFDHPKIESDLAEFNKEFNLPECTTANGCFTKVFASGKKPRTDSGWALEISLDVEWAHAVAPKAKILLVEASSASLNALIQAINVAVKKGATVVSMSWGGDEFSTETNFDSTFKVSGVTFLASSGDSGTGTIWPAASPFVVAVGGTTLTIDQNDQYVSEKAWDGSGGGQSSVEKEPTFQSGFPIPQANGHRGIPDVSYNADPNTGFSVFDSVPVQGQSGWFVIGGTSAGAPQWSSLIAIAKSVGNNKAIDNTTIYNVGKTNYSTAFHDITTGSNGSCGFLCNAAVGYDYVTGLGSPNSANIINLLAAQ